MYNFFSYFFFSLCLSTFSDSPAPETRHHEPFPYNLDNPNAIFEMPEQLKEISGLSMTADSLHVVAVNDEEGIIFKLDKMTCEIVKEIKFWDEGDYEGIEVVGNDAWVIKSSGTLYHVRDYESDSLKTTKIKSFLNKENDVEGLAFSASSHSLYVGCKGKYESLDGDDVPKKAIYQFDIKNMAMHFNPLYLLTMPNIQEYLDHMEEEPHLSELQETFDKDPEDLRFSPSGIAIHPITGDIYVTSSKGKMLLVLNEKGDILYLRKLKKKIHQQPEGICFDTDGTLFIANEGKEGKAKIYKFLYQN